MKSKSKPKPSPYKARPLYGISRVDQPEKANHTWYLRISALGIATTFADKLHGGKRRALEAAQKQRDIYFLMLPERLQVRASRPRPKRRK